MCFALLLKYAMTYFQSKHHDITMCILLYASGWSSYIYCKTRNFCDMKMSQIWALGNFGAKNFTNVRIEDFESILMMVSDWEFIIQVFLFYLKVYAVWSQLFLAMMITDSIDSWTFHGHKYFLFYNITRLQVNRIPNSLVICRPLCKTMVLPIAMIAASPVIW